MENKEMELNKSEEELVTPVADLETDNEFAGYDDEAERAREEAAREAQIEADKLLPPDPDAILEVRHLKKAFRFEKDVDG